MRKTKASVFVVGYTRNEILQKDSLILIILINNLVNEFDYIKTLVPLIEELRILLNGNSTTGEFYMLILTSC